MLGCSSFMQVKGLNTETVNFSEEKGFNLATIKAFPSNFFPYVVCQINLLSNIKDS